MAESPSEIGQETERLADPSREMAASAPTSDEIRSQIEQTRAEISHTIDAIQARLSPRRLVTDAKQTVKDAASGRVPLALVGVAAAVIVIGTFMRSRNRADRRYDRPKHVMHRTSGGPNKTRLLAGVCAGLGCWSAWRANRLGREGTLSSDLAQPM